MAKKRSKKEAIERYNSGVIFYNKRDYDKAVTDFRAALDANPNNAQFKAALANTYSNRGVAKFDAKEYERALNDFEKAHELDRANEQYKENLNIAKDSYKKQKIDKLCENAYTGYNKGKYMDSIRDLREALKMEPEDKDILQALAVAFNGRGVKSYEEGKFGYAIEDFEQAKKFWPAERQYAENLRSAKEAARRKKKNG